MVCANLSFEGGTGNPIASALPDVVCLPLEDVVGIEPALSLLIERLFEIVIIQVLRQLMESGELEGGRLSGLPHPRLRNALVAMHETPAQEWTLDELAMSPACRSVFATTFRETVGITPGHYLQVWGKRLCAAGSH